MSTNQAELFNTLPQTLQDAIQEEGYSPEAVMEGAEAYITNLQGQVSEAKTKCRNIRKAHLILEKQNARMLKVLTQFGKIVTDTKDKEYATKHEAREEAGRTELAYELHLVLMEKE